MSRKALGFLNYSPNILFQCLLLTSCSHCSSRAHSYYIFCVSCFLGEFCTSMQYLNLNETGYRNVDYCRPRLSAEMEFFWACTHRKDKKTKNKDTLVYVGQIHRHTQLMLCLSKIVFSFVALNI